MIGGKNQSSRQFSRSDQLEWKQNTEFNNDTIRIKIITSAHDINDNTIDNLSKNSINSDTIFVQYSKSFNLD